MGCHGRGVYPVSSLTVSAANRCVQRCAEKDDMFSLAEALLKCAGMYTDLQNLCGSDADDRSKELWAK